MTMIEKTSSTSQFRVVVVGGGIAGLVASHCLQLANIDHVVLERGDNIAPPMGGGITIYPHGLRILQQIGCYDRLAETCKPLQQMIFQKQDGSFLSSIPFSETLLENHGRHMLYIGREDFLKLLYDGLPDKSYVKTGRKVRSIQHFDDHVEVVLADGTMERGDIVIGCDGVRSLARKMMWELADEKQPGWIPSNDKSAMTATWKCLVGTGPAEKALDTENPKFFQIVDKNQYLMAYTQKDAAFWIINFRLDPEVPCSDKNPFTEQDAEDLAMSVKNFKINNDLTFGDLWARKYRGFLAHIEEGVLQKWHYGNIVLAGDACHKMTPACGLGGNTAMESVVVICNKLKTLLDSKGGQKPSRQALDAIFESYQQERIERVKKITQASSFFSKMLACETWWHKLVVAQLIPWLPKSVLPTVLGWFVKSGDKLTYGKDHTFPSGRVPWTYV